MLVEELVERHLRYSLATAADLTERSPEMRRRENCCPHHNRPGLGPGRKKPVDVWRLSLPETLHFVAEPPLRSEGAASWALTGAHHGEPLSPRWRLPKGGVPGALPVYRLDLRHPGSLEKVSLERSQPIRSVD
jgi:hypothetical protein